MTAGASRRCQRGPEAHRVSILTRPEGRVLAYAYCRRLCREAVSILTRSEGRVLAHADAVPGLPLVVSILTRPEGRVLGLL